MSEEETESRVTVSEQTVGWTVINLPNARKYIRSPVFNFNEIPLYFRMCLIDKHCGISLILQCDTAISQEINYALGLKKPHGTLCFTGKKTHRLARNGTDFVKMSDILHAKSAADGSVTFFCTLSTAGDHNSSKKKDAQCQTSSSVGTANDASTRGTASSKCVENLTRTFKQLYISGLHSDVIIKVEDREFQVHRCVLSARSPVFAAMFQHEMAEKLSGVVDVADCDAGCFEAFLLFLYTGDVVHVTSVNAAGVYTIAEKYEIIDLKTACIQFLKGNLHVWTFCDAVHLAVAHDETELLEAATEFFIRNSLAILSTPQWKEFIVKNPLMANDLFLKKEQRQHGI